MTDVLSPTTGIPSLPAIVVCLMAGLLSPSGGAAQVVRGAVVEAAAARTPIPGATLELRGTRSSDRVRAVSDSLGRFMLSVPREGLYLLSATAPGYVTHVGDTVRVGGSEVVQVEVRMDPTVIPLQPLVITARAKGGLEEFEARRRAGGFGRYLTRTDIDARGTSRTTDLFRGMPGVVLTAQRRGGSSLLQMRGTAGLCQPAIWIDGQFIAQYPGGTTLDDVLSPSVIDAAEVYNTVSAAPIQYRTGSCGVLLFWTRRGDGNEGAPLQWKKILIGAGSALAFILLIR